MTELWGHLKNYLFVAAGLLAGAGFILGLHFLKDSQGLVFVLLFPALLSAASLLTYRFYKLGFSAGLGLNLSAASALLFSPEIIFAASKTVLLSLLLYSSLSAVLLFLWRKKELAGQQNLRWLSATDPLTQVYNHRYFHQRLEEELARAKRTKAKLSLVFVDLDHFKQYNDSQGHILGDQALRLTAAFLNRATRLSDIVCRYGGDEFVIILPDTGTKEALVLARRLVKNFAKHKLPARGGGEAILTLSVGLAAFPDQASHYSELIRQADSALYRAKEQGRNQAFVYDSSKDPFLVENSKVVLFENCEKKLTSYCQDKNSTAAKNLEGHVFFGQAIGLGHGKIDALKLKPYLEELSPS